MNKYEALTLAYEALIDFDYDKRMNAIQVLSQVLIQPEEVWVGLTDDERDAIIGKVIGFNSCVGWEEDFAKAIEAMLKEKNT